MFSSCWLLLILLAVRSHSDLTDHSNCLFENCLCSRQASNYNDIKCIYDINSGTLNTGFPRRQQLDYNEINIMLVNRYRFTRIPDHTFANLSIRTLILAENDLEVLTPGAFASIRALRMLHVIEKKLRQIEPGTFEPLGNKLTELGLVDIVGMSTQRVDELFRDLLHLERLTTFKLTHSQNEFKDEWMASLGNLSYLSLASNRLRSLSVDLFEFSSSLISLDLNDNRLVDLDALFVSFQPVRANLKELKLSANTIDKLTDFPEFPSLEFLDLSRNNLVWVRETTFHRLFKLNYLHLESNSLRSLHPGLFSPLANLLVLNLANNYLNSTPIIRDLPKLQSLDVSNQNGELEFVGDFAFERYDQTKSSLSIDLSRNRIRLGFADRVFCSHFSNVSQIYELAVSYASVKTMSRCVWRQLGSALMMPRVSLKVTSDDEPDNDGLIDFSDVCNCRARAYALAFNVELVGLCSAVTDAACFAPNSYTRLTKEEFVCDQRFICK